MENFELMLKELRFLPQKREMLDQLKAWESGRKSLHEIMLYIEKVLPSRAVQLRKLLTHAKTHVLVIRRYLTIPLTPSGSWRRRHPSHWWCSW